MPHVEKTSWGPGLSQSHEEWIPCFGSSVSLPIAVTLKAGIPNGYYTIITNVGGYFLYMLHP